MTKTPEELIKMNREEFDTFMCQTFPELFVQRCQPMSQTSMCWGFDIGPGWYNTLYQLCLKLESIKKICSLKVEFSQIKEKMGSARFYTQTRCNETTWKDGDEKWNDIIDCITHVAEEETDHICAACGMTYYTKIKTGSWVYDTCKECTIKNHEGIEDSINFNEQAKEIIDNFEKAIYNIRDINKIKEINNYLNNTLKENK